MKRLLVVLGLLSILCMGEATAEGTRWYPFMEVHPRTMHQYAHDIVSGHPRVSGDELLVRLRLQELDYETVADFAHALLTDPNFSEKVCTWKRGEMPIGFGIERTDVTGTQFSTWDRDNQPLCRSDEMVIYYQDRPIILPWCGNIVEWPQPVAEIPRTVWVEDLPVTKHRSDGLGVTIGVGSPYYGSGISTGILLENGSTTTLRSGHLVTE